MSGDKTSEKYQNGLHFKEIMIDVVVTLAEEIPVNSRRVSASNLIGREKKVETFDHVPNLRRRGSIELPERHNPQDEN